MCACLGVCPANGPSTSRCYSRSPEAAKHDMHGDGRRRVSQVCALENVSTFVLLVTRRPSRRDAWPGIRGHAQPDRKAWLRRVPRRTTRASKEDGTKGKREKPTPAHTPPPTPHTSSGFPAMPLGTESERFRWLSRTHPCPGRNKSRGAPDQDGARTTYGHLLLTGCGSYLRAAHRAGQGQHDMPVLHIPAQHIKHVAKNAHIEPIR